MDFMINSMSFRQAVEIAADITSRKVKMNSLTCWAEAVTIEASKTGLTICGLGNNANIKVDLNPAKDGYICDKTGITTVMANDLANVMQSFVYPAPINIFTEHGYLKLISECDSKIFKTIRANKSVTHYPRLPDRYDQMVTIHRPHFIKGMQKVRFAMGEKQDYIPYHSTCIEVFENAIRFTAGSGSRFAVYRIGYSEPIITTPGKIKIIVPKLNVNNLLRVFQKINSPTLQVKYAKMHASTNVKEQITFQADNIVMALYGLEDFQSYPDVDKVLTHPHSYQICTSADDWRRVSNAIHLTNPEYIWTPRTQLTANLHQGYFEIEVNSDSSFRERIDFELESYVANTTQGKLHRPWVRFESSCLHEVAHKMYGAGRIHVCFEDQANLDAYIKNGSRTKSAILVRYPPQKLKDGSTETRTIFFGVSTAEFK